MNPVRKVVVGTDGSEHARAALREAIDLARRLDDGIVVASVSPPPPDFFGKPLWQEWVTQHQARARDALDEARRLVDEAGFDAEYEMLEGEPADALARFAETRDADLLVVGTRGTNAIAGVLLGSVSTALLRRSRRPVVVVREPTERAREEAADRASREPRPAPA
jgi:nucleotide-binding universal stress UspA family protein